MPLINLSVKHGQSWDAARSNFVKGIESARGQFGMWIRQVTWSADRTSAELSGPGFTIAMSVDAQEVHAQGDLPAIAQFLEAPLRGFLEKTFARPLPPPGVSGR
jgi:hypothetical protein